ncbi:MAG: NB-ARC domain-containing protein [Candidatus Competibacteraceae bacterium]
MSGKIVTFYSYKGGVGRSMTLANVAWILAANNNRVIVIDWDLEAPGLHRYFRPFLSDKELEQTPGLIDLVWDYADIYITPENAPSPGTEDLMKLANAQRYAVSLEFPFLESKGCLHFLGPGKQDFSYTSRVRQFDWKAFYERLAGKEFLDVFRKRFNEQKYDFVLIDSRTGVADTSGICTLIMPDIVVLCFSYNRQNIVGIATVAQSIRNQRPEVEILPVPSRIEGSSVDKLKEANVFARELLDQFLPNTEDKSAVGDYWDKIKVMYRPQYAWEETLAVLSSRPNDRLTMLEDMQWLAGRITGKSEPLSIPALEQSICDRYLGEFRFSSLKELVFKGKPSYYVPLSPPNHLLRSKELEQLEALVIGPNQLISISGISGTGKSVLATDFARRDNVERVFSDGIYWLTFSLNTNIVLKQAELIRALGFPPPNFESCWQGLEILAELTRGHACLVVLDNVWEKEQVEAFNGLGQRCRLLLTTRNKGLLENSQEYPLHELEQEQAHVLLANCIGKTVDELPSEARDVARECGYLPLALSTLGTLVKEGIYNWQSVLDRLHQVTDKINNLRDRLHDYESPTGLLAALEISVESLAPELKEALFDCAIFPEDAAVSQTVLQTLWSDRPLKDKPEKVVQFFVDCSFMYRDGKLRYQLHDLYHDYLFAKLEDPLASHRHLLENYRKLCYYDWSYGPDDGYFFQYLPCHLVAIGDFSELRKLLLNYNWISAKLKATEIEAVIADYTIYKNNAPEHDESVALVEKALRSSIQVLSSKKTQLPNQLFEQLRNLNRPDIITLLKTSISDGGFPPPVVIPQPCVQLKAHDYGIHDLVVTPNGRYTISASWDGNLKLWKLEDSKGNASLEYGNVTFTGHRAPVRAVAVTPDNKRVISGSDDHELRVWELETGKLIHQLGGHSDSVYAVVVLPDGRQAISGSRDRTLKRWDFHTATCLATFENAHDRQIYALAVLPDGKHIISGSRDCTLKLWNLETGAVKHTLVGHTARVLTVAALPDGWRAISGSSDCTLKLWDLDNGTLIRTLEGHEREIYSVAVLSDGRRAVSGSCDSTLRLWDMDKGECICILGYHASGVNSVEVLPDGKHVISGSADCTLKLWKLAD